MPSIMTLAELRQATHAYDGFATIENCDLPDYYREVFPKHCECGAEMIMTKPGNTQLQCCNPECWVKMGHRLSYFVSKLGYKGFGEQSALQLVSAGRPYFKYPTFLSAFLMTDGELNLFLTEHVASVFAEIREDIKSRQFHFSDAIAALGIPNIGARSAFFDVVKSPVVLLQYLLQDRSNDLCDAAGISAPITRFQLSTFKLDVLTLMKDVMPNIMDTPKGEVYVAITGRVSVDGTYYTRSEFIDLCDAIREPDGSQPFKLVETKASAKLQHVIADAPSNSDKYRLGQQLGILITANEFYHQLKDAAGTNEPVETNNNSTVAERDDGLG